MAKPDICSECMYCINQDETAGVGDCCVKPPDPILKDLDKPNGDKKKNVSKCTRVELTRRACGDGKEPTV